VIGEDEMFVATFYSYKGGVGRTSALVNVAHRLVRRGKRVFILDFDLEAPGIDSYGLVTTAVTTPGLVEYISAFTTTGKIPELKEFVLPSTLPEAAGRLFVMRGGRKDESYKAALGQLDWKVLYKQRKGFLVMENLKAAIEKIYTPDYLLIDARTGLTDISGICTLQLPHLVVLLFSLNEQSVSGVSGVLQSIRGNKLNREIQTLLVASPVPDMTEWVEARSARFNSARKAMGNPADVVVPYDPFLAFGEYIVDGQSEGQTKSHLGKAYDLLADKLIAANRSDIITLLKRAKELMEEGQHDLAESHYRGVVDAIPDSLEAWVELGKFEKLRGRLERACEHFEKAYSINPIDCEVLAQLTSTYGYFDRDRCKRYNQEFLKCDQKADRIHRVSQALLNAGLAEIAQEGLMLVTSLEPKNNTALIDLAQAHMQLRHYRQAVDVYNRGLKLDPNSLVCAYNLGVAYQRLEDPRSLEFYQKAIDIFEQSKQPLEKNQLANAYEAMSRAYIAVGRIQRGLELLEEALAVAKEGLVARIFSSTTYEYLPKAKFVSEVSLRLQDLHRKFKGHAFEGKARLPN
jgi:tetratricopeptide (TPR) repeat protein